MQVVDAGRLASPLPMDLEGDDLQSVVDGWATQHAPHALVGHHGVLVLQLKRYHSEADTPQKNRRSINFAPGQTIAVPVFDGPEGISTSHQAFYVAYTIIHHGDSTTSGHYQAVLSVPGSEGPEADWEFHVCNDRTAPRPATEVDILSIRKDSYLIGLIRSP